MRRRRRPSPRCCPVSRGGAGITTADGGMAPRRLHGVVRRRCTGWAWPAPTSTSTTTPAERAPSKAVRRSRATTGTARSASSAATPAAVTRRARALRPPGSSRRARPPGRPVVASAEHGPAARWPPLRAARRAVRVKPGRAPRAVHAARTGGIRPFLPHEQYGAPAARPAARNPRVMRHVDGEPACKRGSVPAPERRRWPSICAAYLGRSSGPLLPRLALLRVGFAEPPGSPRALVRSYRTVSPLPVLPGGSHRRSALCGTFLRVTPTGR
jgi:hypothetical protein